MRILVIEDSVKHQDAARETMLDHELTIASTYDEAVELLTEYGPEDRELIRRHSLPKGETIPLPFDVVLIDMMMPMGGRETLAPGIYHPTDQVPYGFVLALRAAARGAKYVAMVTDTNHHQSAMSAALDLISGAYYREGCRPNFEINGAKVMFVHAPFLEDKVGQKPCTYYCQGGTCTFCAGTGQRDFPDGRSECKACPSAPGKCSNCVGTGQVDDIRYDRKDWGRVLQDLTA